MVRADAGFAIQDLSFARVRSPKDAKAAPDPQVLDELLRRVQRLPGVRSATLGPEPASGGIGSRVTVDGSGGVESVVTLFQVLPDYFDVAGIRLRESHHRIRLDDDLPLSAVVRGVDGETTLPGARLGDAVKYFRSAWEGALIRARIAPSVCVRGEHPELSEPLRWHDLRHENASRLVEQGVPLSQVRDLMGHASIITTERYDTQRQEVLDQAAKKLQTRKIIKFPSRSERMAAARARAKRDSDARKRLQRKGKSW